MFSLSRTFGGCTTTYPVCPACHWDAATIWWEEKENRCGRFTCKLSPTRVFSSVKPSRTTLCNVACWFCMQGRRKQCQRGCVENESTQRMHSEWCHPYMLLIGTLINEDLTKFLHVSSRLCGRSCFWPLSESSSVIIVPRVSSVTELCENALDRSSSVPSFCGLSCRGWSRWRQRQRQRQGRCLPGLERKRFLR